MTESTIWRPAARVLVLDPADRLLLQLVREHQTRRFWVTPGGGLDADETYEQAAHRELYEETGLVVEALGPCVWTRHSTWTWRGRRYQSLERFFLLRVETTEVHMPALDPVEAECVEALKWWPHNELGASDERVYPADLAARLVPILRGEVPAEPLDIS